MRISRLIAGGVIGLTILLLAIINQNSLKTKPIVDVTTTTTASATQVATQKTTKVSTTRKKTAKRPVEDGTYKVTHYGPDCKGCSGITASGYNVKNTIYYNDVEYGQVRIVAMNKTIPLYSIIKLNEYDGMIAIVLDRGVGNGVIDVLVGSEKESNKLGIKRNVSIEVLRRGK